MVTKERIYLVCRDMKVICIKDDPKEAAITAQKESATVILQCIVENMYKNDFEIDWRHNVLSYDG